MTDFDGNVRDLAERFAELGAHDATGWAASEVREGIAQQARFLVLRHLWRDAIDGWRDIEVVRQVPAARRLLDRGAGFDDVSKSMRLAAYEAVFTVLNRIDEGYDLEAPADAPGWMLMETVDAAGRLSGRDVGGLHESILTLDPSGHDGADFMA